MSIGDGNEYQPRVLSYPTFTELEGILRSNFEILSSSLEYGMPTFIYRWPAGVIPDRIVQEMVFDEIHDYADNLKVWPIIRWQDEDAGIYYTRFVPQETQEPENRRMNYALFIATLATIAIGGWLQATSEIFLTLFYPQGYTIFDIILTTGGFILALMGIIFTHEMGHYLTAKKNGIDATLPYFIPGLPQIGGTFGAFIKQKSPPKNRSALFDVGVMGPWSGFVVTLVVLVIGYLLSVPVTAEELRAINEAYPGQSGELAAPLLFTLLGFVFSDMVPLGGTLYIHPIAFAAWVGCLVTALNLFPTGQLDGGHALRAIIDEKKHKYIGYIAIAVMFLAGYFLMAILVLALSMGGAHPGALDDTVPVSKSRVVVFVLSMIVLVLSIPPLGLALF